ncbi:hypothetical protein [Neobacillus ginsengisoli]|uniref:Uncharacterized protein n=1 Tax=Neobacillus ginsengisoli TaxID=904295 RepID=A0ABT9XQ69_9BACI|nr:hypothetical protein [Neobacillus ginsengisoli]MDQ0197688.1 hypothetical protein [Neobacillus ginsengisoli]
MSVYFDSLLAEYRTIWNNRALEAIGKNSEEILMEAIKRELLDENSHPRIRKNRYEKYYTAVKRVVNSKISQEAKLQLIEAHNQIMEELNEDDKGRV